MAIIHNLLAKNSKGLPTISVGDLETKNADRHLYDLGSDSITLSFDSIMPDLGVCWFVYLRGVIKILISNKNDNAKNNKNKNTPPSKKRARLYDSYLSDKFSYWECRRSYPNKDLPISDSFYEICHVTAL